MCVARVTAYALMAINASEVRAMWRYLAALALSCTMVTQALAQDSFREAAQRSARRAVANTPGASISVAWVEGGEVSFAFGVGPDAASDGSSVYLIGSLTKQLTAAGILRLAEGGALHLDDPVRGYFPSAPANLSIRDLLNHLSGIPNYTDYVTQQFVRDPMPGEMIQGVRWGSGHTRCIAYSNTNYFLLAEIMARVSSSSYADFMSDQIFGPLAMTSTRANLQGPVGRGSVIPGLPQINGRLPNEYHLAWASGAGSVQSNVLDLARWDIAFLSDWHGVRSAVVSNQANALPCSARGPAAYALGWIPGRLANGHTFLSHYGNIDGFTSLNAVDLDAGTGIVLLINASDQNGLLTQLMNEIGGNWQSRAASSQSRPLLPADPGFGRSCRFLAGPLIGQILQFPQFPQYPLRTPCTWQGSQGVVVR